MDPVLTKLQGELAGAIAGLSAEETQAQRAAGKWSVQQIVEHLVLSYQTTAKVVGERLAKGTPTKATPSLMQRGGQIMIAVLGVFPKGRVAPPAVMPADVPERALSGAELQGKVAEALSTMDGLLTEAEAKFGGSRRAISHVVLGPMSVKRWRRFHLAHGEHHVRQILASRGAAVR